jgi:hypothetical protein
VLLDEKMEDDALNAIKFLAKEFQNIIYYIVGIELSPPPVGTPLGAGNDHVSPHQVEILCEILCLEFA